MNKGGLLGPGGSWHPGEEEEARDSTSSLKDSVHPVPRGDPCNPTQAPPETLGLGEGPLPGCLWVLIRTLEFQTPSHACTHFLLPISTNWTAGRTYRLSSTSTRSEGSQGGSPISGQVSQALEDGPWGPYLFEGGSSDRATSARDSNGPSGGRELPWGQGRNWGMGSLTNTRPSAWHLKPSHQLLTPTWPLSFPLLPIRTLMSPTYAFTYSLIHSRVRYLWNPSMPRPWDHRDGRAAAQRGPGGALRSQDLILRALHGQGQTSDKVGLRVGEVPGARLLHRATFSSTTHPHPGWHKPRGQCTGLVPFHSRSGGGGQAWCGISPTPSSVPLWLILWVL